MAKRHNIAPQLIDYESRAIAGHFWLPFVMYRCGFPNVRTPSCNVDSCGFRLGEDARHRVISFKALLAGEYSDEPVDLFVGGSTAFGVGATSDATTISSLLSKRLQRPVVNLGMRSWVLQQNLIQFCFDRNSLPPQQAIGTIYLFVGYNELNVLERSTLHTVPYGLMYQFSQFFEKMNEGYLDKQSRDFLFPADIDDTIVRPANIDDARALLTRDLDGTLRNWSMIARDIGARLVYVLQPVDAWIDRRHSTEEEELLNERYANRPEEPLGFTRERNYYEQWYRPLLVQLCERHGIPFYDVNDHFKALNADGEWLFVDPWHLTDRANGYAADAIAAWDSK